MLFNPVTWNQPNSKGLIFIPREVIVHGPLDKPDQGDKLDCV
jgi:hypothetical protein